MITAYYKDNGNILKIVDKEQMGSLSTDKLVWVDLNFSTPEEIKFIEQVLRVDLRSSEHAEEIELSSRYMELEDLITINSNFLTVNEGLYDNEPVSFFLKGKMLISYRNADLKSFSDTVKKFKVNPLAFEDGGMFMISLFEARIDLDADLLEELSTKINTIGKSLTIDKELDADVLLQIASAQENTMIIRENIIDNQRVVSAMLRSEKMPTHLYAKLRILIKDINSLIDHTTFNFERLEYLQNTFMGLVNLEQNKVVKIFTVVTVIFMPPTLIASIYGMNFRAMPELGWDLGYPFAILLMVASSLFTLYYFRKKKWL